jgi:hypothetical protein
MIRTLMAIAVAGAFALPVAALAQSGGGDSGASSRQEGANPPGAASPGAARSTTSGMDRATGAAHNTNPNEGRASGSGATSHRGRFDALDKNHDGFISRDEAKDATELDTRFSELDKDNDNKLSRDEYGGINAARGSTGSMSSSRSGKAGVPDKGPGAQEPANRALGSAGSGKPEGGGSSNSK